MWYRVFGSSELEPPPANLLEFLQGLESGVRGNFRGDDQGWFMADFHLLDEDAALRLERFLSTEEDVRAELNTWAAWLETHEDNPFRDRLMQHVIGTRQVFTLRVEDGAPAIGVPLCRHLAETTEGVYQVDGSGFFDAAGVLLVPEGS